MWMNELALFAGAGGGILGGMLLGWRTVAAVEIEDYPRRVLLQRQADGILPRFPIWDDVCTFDGKPWRGKVDVVSGGFPCQDISCAGKGEGIDGERSGLWGEMARIIGEVRPRFAFVENSPMLTVRGLGRVLGDLATLGYEARWGVLGADDAGAPHKRDRIWLLGWNTDDNAIRTECGIQKGKDAKPSGDGEALADASPGRYWTAESEVCSGRNAVKPGCSDGTDASSEGLSKPGKKSTGKDGGKAGGVLAAGSWWQSEPAVGRVAHWVAHRVDRLRAIGNGQVPAVARLAWEVLGR